MLLQHRLAIGGRILALVLMFPAAITSSDRWQKSLGKRWRKIHLLTVPALIFALGHTILLASHYLGDLQLSLNSQITSHTNRCTRDSCLTYPLTLSIFCQVTIFAIVLSGKDYPKTSIVH